MALISTLFRTLFDIALYPFRGTSPLVGLVLVSLLMAIGMLLLFKKASDQEALTRIKRCIHACLFEIRLYSDDLPAILRAQLEILRHNLSYLRLSLAPALWTIIPLVILIPHLQTHYGYHSLKPGESTLLKVRLTDVSGPGTEPSSPGEVSRPDIRLEAPSGVTIESPAVWIPSQGEIAWRISATREGDYQLRLQHGSSTTTKSMRVTENIVRVSPFRLKGSLFNQIAYPGEPPLSEDESIVSIALDYPERSINLLGWRLHWLIVFFILSILLAFALKRPFGVTL